MWQQKYRRGRAICRGFEGRGAVFEGCVLVCPHPLKGSFGRGIKKTTVLIYTRVE
jgi:hypothetical protein